MAATVLPPYRNQEQQMSALAKGNRIRSYRAKLKRDIKAGRKTATGFIAAPPEPLHTMKIIDLLLAVPAYGKTKANRVLLRTNTSPAKTVGGLSDRQRREIVAYLEGRWEQRQMERERLADGS